MRHFFLTAAAIFLTGVALTSGSTPDRCAAKAEVLAGPNSLGQYLLYIHTDPRCNGVGRLTRIVTKEGGSLPPWGYFKLGNGAPLFVKYWVFAGAKVQDCTAPNVWQYVKVKGAMW